MYSYLAKKSEAFVIGNYILKQHQLDLMEEYYENPFIGIINWQDVNLEINGFACMGSLQSASGFISPKESYGIAKRSMPIKTVGLIPALLH